jgi:hypothetical protein
MNRHDLRRHRAFLAHVPSRCVCDGASLPIWSSKLSLSEVLRCHFHPTTNPPLKENQVGLN